MCRENCRGNREYCKVFFPLTRLSCTNKMRQSPLRIHDLFDQFSIDSTAIKVSRCTSFLSYEHVTNTTEMRSTLILVTSLYACSVFQYEPVIQPGSHEYLHHMTLYECRGDQAELESAAETTGSVCYVPDKPTFQCNTIAATWSLGSEVCRKLHLRAHAGDLDANTECFHIGKFSVVTETMSAA